MTLPELLENVKDESTFLEFVEALRDDYNNSNQEWESTNVDQFLESSLAWSKDSRFGESQGLSNSNVWKKFAVFLYCGKIYE